MLTPEKIAIVKEFVLSDCLYFYVKEIPARMQISDTSAYPSPFGDELSLGVFRKMINDLRG